jgi:hypothetical protein
VARGYGRATVTHHHGMASTSSMDGWAEQFFCNGESKVIVAHLHGAPTTLVSAAAAAATVAVVVPLQLLQQLLLLCRMCCRKGHDETE